MKTKHPRTYMFLWVNKCKTESSIFRNGKCNLGSSLWYSDYTFHSTRRCVAAQEPATPGHAMLQRCSVQQQSQTSLINSSLSFLLPRPKGACLTFCRAGRRGRNLQTRLNPADWTKTRSPSNGALNKQLAVGVSPYLALPSSKVLLVAYSPISQHDR